MRHILFSSFARASSVPPPLSLSPYTPTHKVPHTHTLPPTHTITTNPYLLSSFIYLSDVYQLIFLSVHRCLSLFLSPSVFISPLSLPLGSAVAQSVERATPSEEVPGSIPAVAARSLLVGSVSV